MAEEKSTPPLVPTPEPQKSSLPPPDPPPVPDPVSDPMPVSTRAAKAKAVPEGNRIRCPRCGAGAGAERRTPDFGTHYTIVCAHCGHREKVAD